MRLGDGTAESHARAQAALDTLWRYTAEFFEGDAVDRAMAVSGEGVAAFGLRDEWLTEVTALLKEATLAMPAPAKFVSGGKQGRHTEHLSRMLAEMQVLQRAHPGAQW